MTNKKVRIIFLIFFLVLVSNIWAQDMDALQQAFHNAVNDAAIAEPEEISRDLTAIVTYNSNLIWREPDDGSKQVLMVTWTDWNGYDDLVGTSIQMNRFLSSPVRRNNRVTMEVYDTTRDIWVTAAPEVQNFCKTYKWDAQNYVLRLEQLLGLPPNNGKTRFVEFWVKPQDLFRPAPDPEITDHEAGLDFPVSSMFVTISDEYKQWFNDLKNSSYGENGYPWTRLGYTYDWANPERPVGLSEFVIRTGATVDVYSVTLNDAYCLASTSIGDWSLY